MRQGSANGRRPDLLEARLSEVLGEQVWRESGIRGPDDTEQLQVRITTLEQQDVDLELKIQERDEDLQEFGPDLAGVLEA
ncbi:hypothetical protein [Streptomyces noursei]|uniref:hypothetical protein n=1 Tax=Streptomyces noursei TaxID=1971 RepID=UPI001676BEF6|nr:hypothetical protein [Streptomyces noursei]MCZ1021411.1 hypothetical protein [Streptomyces noursei]GGX46277.1 hypothetical protein GCM10010341_79980 [Streptomyces noursei]